MRAVVFGRHRGRDDGPGRRWLWALVVRLAINAFALWLAAELIEGIRIEGWRALAATAAIFGAVNALIKPLAHVVGCPLTCLTFGLFALVVNAAMLVLTGWIARQLDLDVQVGWFWAAFWGALLISVASTLLSAFVGRPFMAAVRRPRGREEGSE